MNLIKTLLFLPLISISFYASPAFAYVDPGTGSAVMSAIIGFLVAAGLVIKTYWYKLKSLFGSKKETDKPEAD